MKRLKRFFQKYPILYNNLRRVYLFFFFTFIRFQDHRNRNKLGSLWAEGHYSNGANTPENYWNSKDHPHRSILLKKIDEFAPVSAILEVGCNTGPNLYLLALKYPDANIKGIDINAQVIEMGNNWFARKKITNVDLSVRKLEDLTYYEEKAFNVVFTDAVLIYVNKANIQAVIKEMLRITRKGLILVERHEFEQGFNDTCGLGRFHNGLWIRDYVALLKQYIPEGQIQVTKITPDIWPDDAAWQNQGAIIEVTLAQ